MTEPLRLEADDPQVLEHSAKAVQAPRRAPRLLFRCNECNSELAHVWYVPNMGPLFVSS